MLKSILECRKIYRVGMRLIHQRHERQTSVKIPEVSEQRVTLEFINAKSIEDGIKKLSEEEPQSVLEKCDEDLDYVAPYLKPTFNFAGYVNKSETLQELLKLGVQLYKLEKKDKIVEYILGLKFETDIKEHVIFLHDLGLQVDDIGRLITKNPYIFKESLDDLRTRIHYLKYKKFDDEMITRIVSENPFWLQFSVQRIDFRLGFVQKFFSLTGDEVRNVVVKRPRLVTYNIQHIKVNSFVLKEEMGFNTNEIKQILLKQPNLFTKNQVFLLKAFEYVHNTMKISLEDILKTPEILTYREHKLRERYLFLMKLNRVQFNPRKPNYISPLTMVSGTDSDFATEVAKSSIQAYNEFLKSL